MDIVNLISPEGNLVGVPQDYVPVALKPENGFNFPENVPHQKDLSDDGKTINVTSPEGKLVSIPIEHWNSGEALNQGFKNAAYQSLAEKQLAAKKIANESVDKQLKDINIVPGDLFPIKDKEGKYLLKTPGGETIAVSPKDVLENLLEGPNKLKFANDEAQAIFEKKLNPDRAQTEAGVFSANGNSAMSAGVTDKLAKLYAENYNNHADLVILANKKLEAENEKYKNIALAGTVVGTAGSLLAPVPGLGTAKGLNIAAKLAPEGANLLRGVAAKAIAGAVEGAIVAAPQVLAQGAIMQDTKGAAESLGIGIGIGALFGGAGKLVGAGLEKFTGTAARELKATSVLENLGRSEGVIKSIEDAGIQGAPKDSKFLQTLLDQGIGPKSTTSQIENALRSVSTGEHLTSTLSALDKVSSNTINSESLLSKISSAADEGGQLSLLKDPKITKTIDDLSNKLTNISSADGELTLSSLRKYTSEIGHDINWSLTDNVSNNLKKQVFKDATSELLAAGDLAAQNADAKLASAWAEGKTIAQITEKMRGQLLTDIADGKLTNTLSPMAQKIKDMLSHKITGLAGGAGGAVIGGLPGALIGNAIGNKVGDAVNTAADSLVEKYITNPNNPSRLTTWLSSNKASTSIGSYLAMDAIHSVGERVAAVSPFITKLSEKTPLMFIGSNNPMQDILGNSSKGLSKQEQYSQLSNQVSKLVANPDLMNQQIQGITDGISKNHPELAQQMQEDMNNKMQYLQQILHGKNNSDVVTPFKKQENYKPTAADLKDMEDQLKIAQNPFALLDGLKNGKVTSKQVATASVLNPAVLSQIREEITKEAYSGKSNLTYQQRLAASVIMGQAMDQSLKMLPNLQAAYSSQGQQGATQGKSPKLNTAKMPSAQGTMAQRISGK